MAPHLAAALHHQAFPNGDRARLKRMGVTGPTPLAYHRFLLRHIPHRWQREGLEMGWRTLVAALARQHHNPHAPDISLGRALADSGYSEARLESLLAAEGRVLATLTLRAATRLAAQRARCNWKDTARLLFAFDDEARERINRKIARDYYRTATSAPGSQ
nr:type I-E CRISPR-associated protein Cse2/CasB [Alkalilimnicola ehrlichii]